MRTGPSRRGWPRVYVHLLLRALLTSEDQARAAWSEWTAIRNFDDVTWEEVRLLSPLALRLPALDAQSALRPRIDGLARQMWTQTQLRVAAAGPAFDALSAAGIPFIVFKGAALYADGLGAVTRRIFGDVDILVRLRDFLPALKHLHGAGWGAGSGVSLDYLARVGGIRAGCNLALGRYGDLDLHSHLFHYCRNDEAAEADLWESAQWRHLAGRKVRVPAPEHALLIAAGHSYQSEAGDWAFELATRIGTQPADWRRFASLAGQTGLAAHCMHRFSYLADGLGIQLPSGAMEAVRLARSSAPERWKAWLSLTPKARRNPFERLALLTVDGVLRGLAYSLERKSRVSRYVTPRLCGVPAAKLGAKHGLSPAPACSAQVEIGKKGRISHLLIWMRIGWPRRRRRLLFDLAIDGVTVAVLKARTPRLAAVRGSSVISFRVALPEGVGGPATVSLRALPARKLSAHPGELEILRVGPWPFALLSLSAR